MPEFFDAYSSPDQERIARFATWREQVHQSMKEELEKRLEKQPKPDEEEIMLGAFREEIEPQIRDAVLELRGKGYDTGTSGFLNEFGEPTSQHIAFFAELEDDLIDRLQTMGVRVVKAVIDPNKEFSRPNVPVTHLYSQTPEADLAQVKKQWQTIVDLFPQREPLIEPSRAGSFWRTVHCPERKDLDLIDMQRRLKEEVLSPEIRQRIEMLVEKMTLQQELKEQALSAEEQELKRRRIEEIDQYFDKIEESYWEADD